MNRETTEVAIARAICGMELDEREKGILVRIQIRGAPASDQPARIQQFPLGKRSTTQPYVNWNLRRRNENGAAQTIVLSHIL